MTSRIPQLEQALRELINANRRQAQLRSDPAKFSQLCSSLDVLGDTELALDAYLRADDVKPDDADLYLRTYGVLQALVLQQDAVSHVADSLGILYELDAELTEIREVRNNAVGHPTRRGSAPGRAFNHIVRWSLSPRSLTLYTFDAHGKMTEEQIDTPRLIARQRELLEMTIAGFVETERAREAEHRAQFVRDPLAAAFPKNMGYSLGKIAEEIGASTPLGLGPALLDDIADAIDLFERKLDERGERRPIPEVLDYDAKPARHAILRLKQYFEGGGGCVDADDAQAFLAHLDAKVDALRRLAREFDETYASDPP